MQTTPAMPRKAASSAALPYLRTRNVGWLAVAAGCISLVSFVCFYRGDQILLYGDAVAHINIARRVIDSRTPGPLQLGTVWLPLPHILTIPFISNHWLWQTGMGGSVVSLIAYVLGGLGIARLFWRGGLGAGDGTQSGSTWAGWLAAVVFLLNPNLIYMQSTAMTESLSLALTVWAIVYFAEYMSAVKKAVAIGGDDGQRAVRDARRCLERCAVVLALAMLTRYDSWFLAVATGIAVLLSLCAVSAFLRRNLKTTVWKFALLTASIPLFWFAYNFGTYGNPLEFATGEYSARGIEKRTTRPGDPPHPGTRSITTSAIYYWKDARLNLGEGLPQGLLVLLALAGVLILLNRKRFWIVALLWLPLLFYSLSIAYGGVPIFIPAWWPFSYYNVRYGLELLPAVAIALGALGGLMESRITVRSARYAAQGLLMAAVMASYWSAWRSVPICLREARVNAVTRVAFERKLAAELSKLPPDASILMFTSSHVGALQNAGVLLCRTVNEGNYRMWEAALADPSQWVDYVVAARDDAVWQSAQAHLNELVQVAHITSEGQPEAVIYRVKDKERKTGRSNHL